MDNQTRDKRTTENRELELRPKRWQPPQLLPDPDPEDGYAFRWVRVSTLNRDDPVNISSKFREGWEPVKASTQPKLQFLRNTNSRFPDGIEIGGLLLCKIPLEFTIDRDAYYAEQARLQMESVDNNFMRESDPRMPLFNERRSKVTFGRSS